MEAEERYMEYEELEEYEPYGGCGETRILSRRRGRRAAELLKTEWKDFLEEEDAVSVVEIILIIVVLISLVIIFKTQLTALVTNILSKITSQSNSI